MKRGVFITLEGIDGSGKTTVASYLFDELTARGYDVLLTREPGGVALAEKIRDIILQSIDSHESEKMDARTEALLFAASRRQHLVEKIIPALEKGQIVICDRFIDSSLAYQGYARAIGVDEVLEVNQFATAHRMPDITLYLDIDIHTAAQRVNDRAEKNRLDGESREFYEKVRQGYRLVHERFQERFAAIDASLPLESVQAQALQIILENILRYVKPEKY